MPRDESATPKSILFDVLNNVAKIETQRKFDFLKNQDISSEVLNYLKITLENLKIEIRDHSAEKIMDLMNQKKLEGFCWQTTESAICFFDNTSLIKRGILTFYKHKKYMHSWICFKYKNEEYVFDPCLDILSTENLYTNIFDIKIMGVVSAEEVKKYLIDCCLKKQSQILTEKTFIGTASHQCKEVENEVRMDWDENINSPMFRNNSGYIADIEENQIRKLIVHYY